MNESLEYGLQDIFQPIRSGGEVISVLPLQVIFPYRSCVQHSSFIGIRVSNHKARVSTYLVEVSNPNFLIPRSILFYNRMKINVIGFSFYFGH